MLKKFFAGIFFAAVIFFCGQNNFAEAQDFYVGTSGKGWDYYAMTETFSKGVGAHMVDYFATLKIVKSSSNVSYESYCFSYSASGVFFQHTDGYDITHFVDSQLRKISQYGTPIEWKLYRLLVEHYGDQKYR